MNDSESPSQIAQRNKLTSRIILISLAVLATLVFLLFLPSLLLGDKTDNACETLKTNTALAIEGVVSADFSCVQNFEGSIQRGSVTVNATTETEVVKIMDNVLRAFAAQPDMVPTWRAPSEFKSQDGSILVYPSVLGFNGIPWISDLREHYEVN